MSDEQQQEQPSPVYGDATIRFAQQVMPKQYCPQTAEITMTVKLDGLSFDEAAEAITEAFVDAKSNVFAQLGLDYTIDDKRVIKLVIDSFPETVMDNSGGGGGRSGGRQGGGNARSGGSGGNRGGGRSGGNSGGRGGAGFGGRNNGRGGGNRGGGGNDAKGQAAEDIKALWDEGGADAVADAGWYFFAGDYGECLKHDNYDNGKAVYINDKMIPGEILDALAT